MATLFLFVLLSLFGHDHAAERAQAGAATLQRSYVERTGLYTTTGWWNAANAVTALVDYTRATGDRRYLPAVAHTFDAAQVTVPKAEQTGDLAKMTGFPGFLNDYYDDEGWWALAWIDAYDATREPRYLTMARSIFADMAGGWDETCGGGIWWSKDRTYKNAIANELFFSVAAHLAARSQTPEYADWARREWRWFQGSGMVNRQGLVNDGLTIDKASGTCTNNGRTVWTYNLGVLVGALAEWSKAEGEQARLGDAGRFASAALDHMTGPDGVLHEPCEPKCGPDGVQFKGIFVRNLSALNAASPDKRWKQFVKVNADSLWKLDRAPGDVLGLVWSGPVGEANAGTQSSALDALIAEAGLGKKR